MSRVPSSNIDAIRLAIRDIGNHAGNDREIPSLRAALKEMAEQASLSGWQPEGQRRFNACLDQIHQAARSLQAAKLPSWANELDIQAFPLAVWAVQEGAVLENLRPVVHALALLANRLRAPDDLIALFLQVEKIYAAIPAPIREDRDAVDPNRPWRILLLNRAIIATRSLQPELMETAFNTLAHFLPQDLGEFLQEGIRQLDLVGYPDPVRRVMESYHERYNTPQVLH